MTVQSTDKQMSLPSTPAAVPDWSARARPLLAAQKINELQDLLKEVLGAQPDNHEARQLLAVACGMQERHEEAIAHLTLAIALADFQPDWLFNLGNVLRSAGKAELAIAAYKKLLVLAPGHAHAWFNLGNVLTELHQDAQAADAYRRALLADPTYLKAMVNLAGALARTSQFDEALKVYRQILAAEPKHVGARNNMANLLRDLGQPAQALRLLQDLAQEDPGSARVQNNLGSAFRELGDLPQALACYRRAVALKPDYPEGQMNYAMALLTDGQWAQGWQHYEARLDPRLGLALAGPHLAIPRWQGQALNGQHILVHGEQGLGDMLQFSRFVPLLERRGARVSLLTDRSLKRLLSTLPMEGRVLSEGDAIPPDLSYQVSLLSLPLHLGIASPEQFHATPYLRADAQAVAIWRSRLDEWFGAAGSVRRPRVGIVWAGNPRRDMPLASLVDRRRSLSAQQARQLLAGPTAIDWVSLQKGEQEQALPELRSAAQLLQDFADTAALCEALDAVVTVDTSVAHLSASLGRPTFMLSRFDACWRWGLAASQTPWYASMHIIRQHRYGDWSEALKNTATALGEFLARR